MAPASLFDTFDDERDMSLLDEAALPSDLPDGCFDVLEVVVPPVLLASLDFRDGKGVLKVISGCIVFHVSVKEADVSHTNI